MILYYSHSITSWVAQASPSSPLRLLTPEQARRTPGRIAVGPAVGPVDASGTSQGFYYRDPDGAKAKATTSP